ncbi:hypothetical protein LZC95_08160 [Pendulispora brunnea]|uniref:HEAT repeat domain-containing protein n=1 Tax=Pendulispora brunnea TaxID=2905690 RepID=A0ABZ2KDY7_9BACT
MQRASTTLLESLDKTDWQTLRHAYGSAVDIPGHLRALMSSDANARSEALLALNERLLHGGARFDAAPAAIPHLIEVLAADRVSGKAGILRTLAHLVARPYSVRPDLGSSPSAAHGLIMEHCYRAARPGIPVFLALAHRGVWNVRAAANYLLGTFRDEHMRILAFLFARSALAPAAGRSMERHSAVRAAMAVACARLLQGTSAFEAVLTEIHDGDPSELVRTCSALALATHGCGGVNVLATLFAALPNRNLAHRYGQLFWTRQGSAMIGDITYALSKVSPGVEGATAAGMWNKRL